MKLSNRWYVRQVRQVSNKGTWLISREVVNSFARTVVDEVVGQGLPRQAGPQGPHSAPPLVLRQTEPQGPHSAPPLVLRQTEPQGPHSEPQYHRKSSRFSYLNMLQDQDLSSWWILVEDINVPRCRQSRSWSLIASPVPCA
jgi:hypothetical protein